MSSSNDRGTACAGGYSPSRKQAARSWWILAILAVVMAVIAPGAALAATPTVSSVSPAIGRTVNPDAVTITGTSFSASGNSVTFDGVAGTITAESPTSITVTPPDHAAGSVSVRVTNAGGESTFGPGGYYYVEPPKVVATFGATSIANGGSTTLTLTASNPNPVPLGGITIAARVLPSGLTGSLAGGTCSAGAVSGNAVSLNTTNLSANGDCTVIVTVTSTAPNTYSYTTGTIAATGANTTGFALPGDTATTPTGLTVASSTNANLSNLALSQGTLNPGFSAGTTAYTASVAANITSLDVTPAVAGPAGTTVTVNGNPATSGSPTSVALNFGANAITVRVTAQSGATRDYGITVTRTADVPTVISVSPEVGPGAGGIVVMITGTGFSAAAPQHAVKFGATEATYTVLNDNQISAITPARIGGGATVTVTTPGGTSATSAGSVFTYVPVPVVSTSSPASGPVGGGTSVRITGSAFGRSADMAVKFGAVGASYTVFSDTRIDATAPPGSAGTVDITVISPGGTSLTSPSAVFTYVAAPTLSAASPDSGPTAGGQAVTLTGTDLTDATLTIDGASVAIGSNDGTNLAFTTPAHLSGSVPVVVTTAGGSATASYTYVLRPAAGNLSSITVLFNTPRTINVAAAISGSHTSIAIGTGPAHGTTSIAGDVITYTPNANYVGADSFTYTATGPGGISAPATASLTVNQGTQTIQFAALSNTSLSPTPLMLSATASSGLTVSFSTSTTEVCTVSGTTLALVATGTCTIDADQAGDASYAAASRVSRSLTVTPASLAISPGTPSDIVVSASYDQRNLAAGGVAPYTYALASGTLPAGTALDPASGTVTGTPTTAGAFSYAIQATDSQVPAVTATGSTVSGMIAKGSQAISFTSAAPGAAVGGAPYTVTATASSSLGVVYSLDGASTGCALSSSTVTFTGTGTCVIDANQAGDTNWNAAPQVQQSFAIGAAGAVSLSVAYAPTPITSGASGTLTLTFSNPNAAVTPAFSSELHSNNIVFTRASGLGGSCGIPASRTSAPSTSQVSFTNIQIPQGTCTVTLPYMGAAPGTASWAFDGFTPSGYPATPGATSNVATVLPSVTSISLATGPASQAVTISGTGFSTTPGDNMVHFGSATGTVTAASAASLTVTAPATGGGTVPVSVTVNGQTSPGSVTYTFIDKPVATDKPGVAVPYNGTGTAIDLAASITGGPHSAIAVATGPAHGTTGVAGDVVTYRPATGYSGPDSFTYIATGAGGTSDAARVSVTVATPVAPIAADTAMAVPYAGTGTAIDLSGTISGVHTSIAIGTAPVHGTVTIAGDIVTYTPSVGYFGTDGFTYTATGPGGTSAPATVNLTVATPAIPVAANKSGVGVPYASAGTAIDLSGSITGVRSSLSIGTAPAHGTVSIAGEVVTYTPAAAYYGADSFTYTATGPGGTSAPATVTLTVATPTAPTASDKSGTSVAYGSTGTAIDLAGSITGTHSALAIGTAPSHGTATVNGDIVTYMPASGYYGADSFTYTVTGPGGTSAPATVSLTVATPPPPVAAPGAGSVAGSSTSAGTSVNIDLSSLVSGVYDTIRIDTVSAHGTVTLSGGGTAMAPGAVTLALAAPAPYIATYTPAANYTGTDSFTYVAVGPGGTSAPGMVTITVTGQAPEAAPKAAKTGDGQTVSVMLTDGARGGPFTAATVVSVSPTNAATTSIVASGSGAYRLDVTPNNRFGGAIAITYTLSNIHGTSAPATVTLTVEARPDPRGDPNVGAISDAQAEAARRFARAQVSNFMRRNEQLHHGGGYTGMDMGLTLAARDASSTMQRPDDRNWGLAITERMRMSGEDPAIGRYANDAQSPLSHGDTLGNGRMLATDPHAVGAAPGAPSSLARDASDDGKRRIGSVATWAGGSIDIGTRDATTDRAKVTATTAGLSAGVDIKLAENVLVGAGGGYGNDLSRIGSAAQVRSKSTLYAAYASVQPIDNAFIDAMIGRGGLDFTTRRVAATVNSAAIGNRGGNYTVGAISAGIDQNSGALIWSIYGRGEYMGAGLDSYAETGAGRDNLRFAARQVESITGTLGGRIEYRQRLGFGSVTPRIRAEWNHEFADVDAQWLDYADIPGSAIYALSGNGWKREQLQLSLGTRFDILKGGWSFDFETGLRAGQGEKAGTLQLRMSKEF
ncbi:IPT/TIG domain-containing protein [Sphingomonas kyeonggiensis]|uniref:Autotransporter domain-containing protein n=1 Tax=Sphingomonas kyeonggiensis TaxID=1268553 RepID=A0A7W6JSJ1_9SPHN|nr:IPT/TIG domain-containing protein [Sphingomonas kyeonggiensis]MBB4097610.1 hypothetical protein [Sphingomonas kyeonggiensis]